MLPEMLCETFEVTYRAPTECSHLAKERMMV